MAFDEKTFEDEVRRIARALWPSAEYQGAAFEDGAERDGVFITDECVHLIECTVERAEDKAVQDSKKIHKLAERMRNAHPTKAIKGWFITLHEPTDLQRRAVDKYSGEIVALALDQYRSKLINASGYLQSRKTYNFGSMEDAEAKSSNFHFVQIDIWSEAGQKYGVLDLIRGLADGKRFVFLGDYGAGKSTTMRELFIDLQKRFFQNKLGKFPILLNLRDHYGQINPAEALIRHANNIGFSSPHHLISAWRSGYAILLLDGFDEISTVGWSGQASRLRKLRLDSMQLIREFVKESPEGCGLAIAGRNNFFDSIPEMQKALGLNNQFICLNLRAYL